MKTTLIETLKRNNFFDRVVQYIINEVRHAYTSIHSEVCFENKNFFLFTQMNVYRFIFVLFLISLGIEKIGRRLKTLRTSLLVLVKYNIHCTDKIAVYGRLRNRQQQPVRSRDNFVKRSPVSKSIKLSETQCKSPYLPSLLCMYIST